MMSLTKTRCRLSRKSFLAHSAGASVVTFLHSKVQFTLLGHFFLQVAGCTVLDPRHISMEWYMSFFLFLRASAKHGNGFPPISD